MENQGGGEGGRGNKNLRSQQIYGEVVAKHKYVWIIADGLEQCSLDLSARHISGMDDTVMGVASFSSQMQLSIISMVK